MEITSYKNKLQEHYQKRGLPLPRYLTTAVVSGGFRSSVTLADSDRKYSGTVTPTKRAAEMSAARVALGELGLEPPIRRRPSFDFIEMNPRQQPSPTPPISSALAAAARLLPPAAFVDASALGPEEAASSASKASTNVVGHGRQPGEDGRGLTPGEDGRGLTPGNARLTQGYDPTDVLHDGGVVDTFQRILLIDLESAPIREAATSRIVGRFRMGRIVGFVSTTFSRSRHDEWPRNMDVHIVASDQPGAVDVFIAMVVAHIHRRYDMVYIFSCNTAAGAIEDIVPNVKHLTSIDELTRVV